MREGKDRGGTWLIKHYGDALLHLAGIRGFEKWRAIQPQVIQQGRTPDGLLIPAEQLLAAKEVGLIPWVPLAQYQGSPEVLLQQCRQRIEKEAPPREINNLLAITYIMARMRYNVAELLALLGEGPMIDFLKNPWRYKSTWLSNPFRI